MKNVPTKNIGDEYSTQDFNIGVNDELKSIVTDSGQGFNDADTKQILKSVINLASSRLTYVEDAGSSGAAYLLKTHETGVEAPALLSPGAQFSFIATNANSVINPTLAFSSGIPGVFNLKFKDGSHIPIDEIQPTFIIDVMFDGTDMLIKNLNDAISTQDVNQDNYYLVTGNSGNEYSLTASSGHNPLVLYDGMPISFIVNQINTGSVTLKIGSIVATPALVDSGGATMQPGDLNVGDLVSAIYHSPNFNVVKRATVVRLNSDNNLEGKSDTGGYNIIFNNAPALFPAPGPLVTILPKDDKRTIIVYMGVNVQLPVRSSVGDTFSIRLVLINSNPSPTNFVIQAGGADIIRRFSGTLNSIQVFVDSVSEGMFECIAVSGGAQWYLAGYESAQPSTNPDPYRYSGLGRACSIDEINAGTDTIRWVTPATLSAKTTFVELDKVYPIGTPFFSQNPLVITNPASIVPGWGTLTWALISGAGDHHNLVISSSYRPAGGLRANATDPFSGRVGGTTLTEAHLPAHKHVIPFGEGTSIYGPVAIWGLWTDGGVNTRWGLGAGSDSNNTWAFTSPVGSNAAHDHDLNFNTYAFYCYIRTA
jgi:hypothetical protein